MRGSGLHNDPQNEHNRGQPDNVWEQDPHTIMLRQIARYQGKQRATHTAEARKKAYSTRNNATGERI